MSVAVDSLPLRTPSSNPLLRWNLENPGSWLLLLVQPVIGNRNEWGLLKFTSKSPQSNESSICRPCVTISAMINLCFLGLARGEQLVPVLRCSVSQNEDHCSLTTSTRKKLVKNSSKKIKYGKNI